MKNKPIVEERVIFEHGACDEVLRHSGAQDIDDRYLRHDIEGMTDPGEPEVVRHFTRLSYMNHSLDAGMYPLGSCTMKYNPKVMESAAGNEGFSALHPMAPQSMVQGVLELMYGVGEYLKAMTGMDSFSLQPAAGAHGELAGMLIAAKYHRTIGTGRNTILIPDTAHGTNPASAAMAGFKVTNIPSGSHGMIESGTLRRFIDGDTAGIMLTIPNTLGIFEEQIVDIAGLIHDAGGIVYVDGANFNALLGKARYGDMGADIVHVNLHKTFATPHGSGGPGAGAIGVSSVLREFLPVPVVERRDRRFVMNCGLRHTVGRLVSFYGNTGILIRAYAYMRMLGTSGAGQVAETATLNANYIRALLKDRYNLPYGTPTLHEVVFNDALQNVNGVKTIDIAKRLIDYGFHPPTIYFPLIVHGAIMIEPTETESKEEIDRFVSAMRSIADEVRDDPQLVIDAPHTTPVRRVDEVKAAREPRLVYRR
ncbi:MAG: aminomethyl-transferring glycine dehydrogenase subunit GcvPB [Deltaproteobacteria bacterium]|nr:aminomethyl-transferring glycine dehydrogenase subunit GcvPB [Deltaproteobacteria bacterium]MCL5278064.1 aminomethyl-transferring glycine dehydrogenase subunit GcvPB [Deltaproteobacteria bacterium]